MTDRLFVSATIEEMVRPTLAPRSDPAGNVKPDKERSAQRIDPIQAPIFAVDGWMRHAREAKHVSVYRPGA